jgi:vacuolar-type H+-ATPase subunit I/STV1
MGVMLFERAKSVKQQRAMGMAHAIQKGEMSASNAGPEVRRMAREMKPGDVTDFASTKHKGLPNKKACMKLEDFGREIVNKILNEDNPTEELQEVQIARGILNNVSRLQSSLGDTAPEVQRELTSIRAAANNLIRLHNA